MLKKISAAACVVMALAGIYLFAPPPQHASAQFIDQSTYGGVSGGAANAQTISIPNFNYATNMAGVKLTFTPGFTNTGPATLTINSSGAVALVRPSSIGNVAFSGGELMAGEVTCAIFTGSVWQLACNVDMTPIGRTVEYRGSAVPRGTLVEDGSCVSQTTYAALFSVISTNYGSCSAGLFALPDSRGTSFVALDGQGTNGNAGRITTASCATPNAVGLCGHETSSITLITSNLPPYTPSGSILSGGVQGLGVPSGAGGATVSTGTGIGIYTNSAFNNLSFSGTAQGGTSTPIVTPVLQPSSFGRRAIKY